MAIKVKAYSNGDDVLIAWSPDDWPAAWAGFRLERENVPSGVVTVVNNRIPARPGDPRAAAGGIPSAVSPIRRCVWIDHGVTPSEDLRYRVTAMIDDGHAGFAVDPASISDWTDPLEARGDLGGGLSAYFNRGTLMSQVVSRFVKGDVSSASLRDFTDGLGSPGNPARRYLSGQVRTRILTPQQRYNPRRRTAWLR